MSTRKWKSGFFLKASSVFLLAGFFLIPKSILCAAETVAKAYPLALKQLNQGKLAGGVKTYYKIAVLTEPLLSLKIRQRDLATARARISARLQEVPDDPRAALLMVLTDRILEEIPAAFKDLQPLLRKAPRSLLLQLIYGEILVARGEVNKAKKLFGRFPEDPRALPFRKQAANLLARIPAHPKQPEAENREALLQRAYRHLDLLEREHAERVFREVFNRFPKHTEAPIALIDLYMEQNQLDKAQAILTAWEAQTTTPLLLPVKESRLLYLQGRFRDVIPVLKKVLKEDHGNEHARFLMAESCYQVGRTAEAAGHFKLLWNADQQNIGLFQRMAHAMELAGQTKRAVRVFELALKTNPREPFLLLQAGELNLRLKRFDQAEKHFMVLTQMEEHQETAWEALANIRVARNKAREEELLQRIASGKNDQDQPAAVSNEDSTPNQSATNETQPEQQRTVSVSTLKMLSQMCE